MCRRRLIIELVLYTDLARHFEFISVLQGLADRDRDARDAVQVQRTTTAGNAGVRRGSNTSAISGWRRGSFELGRRGSNASSSRRGSLNEQRTARRGSANGAENLTPRFNPLPRQRLEPMSSPIGRAAAPSLRLGAAPKARDTAPAVMAADGEEESAMVCTHQPDSMYIASAGAPLTSPPPSPSPPGMGGASTTLRVSTRYEAGVDFSAKLEAGPARAFQPSRTSSRRASATNTEGGGDVDTDEWRCALLDPEKVTTEQLLVTAIKFADLGHCLKPWPLHKEWSERVNEEFWRLGDREKAMHVPVSPLCDRTKDHDIPKSQAGFFQFICRPFYTVVAVLTDGDAHFLKQINDNDEKWKRLRLQHVEERIHAESPAPSKLLPPVTSGPSLVDAPGAKLVRPPKSPGTPPMDDSSFGSTCRRSSITDSSEKPTSPPRRVSHALTR